MAGTLYLGRNKVCPAILIGGGDNEKLSYFSLPYYIDSNGTLQIDENPFEIKLSKEVKDLGDDVFGYNFESSIPFSISIVSVDFSGLESISGFFAMNHFLSGSDVETIDVSGLKSVTGDYAVAQAMNSTKLTSVEFHSLDDINGSNVFAFCFADCILLGDIYFNSLKTSSFGEYTNQFNLMLSDCSGVTLHFPSNLSQVIPTLDSYPNFGGQNTVILYDLPETE